MCSGFQMRLLRREQRAQLLEMMTQMSAAVAEDVENASRHPTQQLHTQRGRPHLAAAGRNNTQAFAQPLAELALKPARGVAHYGGAYP